MFRIRQEQPPMETKEIAVSDWPAPRQPIKATCAGMIAIASVFVAGSVHWLLGITAAMAMMSTLGEVLLPSRYHFDDKGFSITGLHIAISKAWPNVKDWRKEEDGFVVIELKSKHYFATDSGQSVAVTNEK